MNLKYKEDELLLILGVTPFVALTDSAVNALGIGMVVLITIFFSALIFRFIGGRIKEPERTFILIIVTSMIISILSGFLSHKIPALYSNLVVFIPLIAVNSYILQSINKIDNKHSGIKCGFSSALKYLPAIFCLFLTGTLREIFGKGMILNKPLLNVDPNATLILFFNSPVGAFTMTGIVIAFYGILKKNE